MPDSPNWLSVEQREEYRKVANALYKLAVVHADTGAQAIYRLLDHAFTADRREAELREQLAAAEIIIDSATPPATQSFSEEVAMLRGNQIPHVEELNVPGNISCICLACVLKRQRTPPLAKEGN